MEQQFQLLQSFGIIDLLMTLVGDVKHIDHLIQMGGNFGQHNREFKLKELATDRVEQPGAIMSEDIYNRTSLRRFIID